MAFGLLEKLGHLFLKKLYPHLPFESYFSTCKSCERIQSPYNCVLRKALVPEMFLDMHNVTRKCLDLILKQWEVKNSQKNV